MAGMRSGGRLVADQLRLHGVDTVWCVPGESYLAVLDALHDTPAIRTITCRQEGGAAMMAEAQGKLTGRPGICMVTRGPGATNASAGLHVAMQDATPMILFIGQVARGQIEREAFQEIDYRRMLGQLTKWTAQIDDPARIPEFVARAFQVATSGRPGPVALALPEDMLTSTVDVADARPWVRVESWPGPSQLAALRDRLAAAARPMLLLGGAPWDEGSVAAIGRFAAANRLPVATTFRRADRFDNAHPCYAGDLGIGPNPRLVERVHGADLLVVIGARLGEMTTDGYELIDLPVPRQRLIHIHPDPQEPGRVYHPDLAIIATPRETALALAELEPVADPAWAGSAEAAHADYLAWQEPAPNPGPVQMGEILRWLERELPPGQAIYANGAGNFAGWVHRFHQYRGFGTQLAPTSGSMGYGFPAAIAAAVVRPDRLSLCFAGDGDFLMTGQELATAVQQRLRLVVVVVNNGIYGTIRMHQEREYPGRVMATGLHNPDFVAYARAFGAFGVLVERTEDFAPAFAAARAYDGPALIELRLDPEAITPRTTLTALREAALRGG